MKAHVSFPASAIAQHPSRLHRLAHVILLFCALGGYSALARAQGTVEQLRAAISTLESQLAKAQARGDQSGIRKAEEALAARRSWLAEAERTLAEFSG